MGTKLKVAADMATGQEYDDRPLARKPDIPTCTACAHLSYLRLLRLTGFAQRVDKLVGAAGGTTTAGIALEHGGDVLDALAVDEFADSLEIAVAAADEIHVLDGIAVKIDVDLTRAYAPGSIGVHIRFLSLGWCKYAIAACGFALVRDKHLKQSAGEQEIQRLQANGGVYLRPSLAKT